MPPRPVVALAGGVGAARFLCGLVQVVEPRDVTVIVNTGDDRDFFGLRVCPDLDILTYTLSGRVRGETGWGLEGDSFRCLEGLRELGHETWFQLGDRDLATHIHRSQRLREGATLTQVTAEIAAAFGLEVELLPMTEAPAPTRIVRHGGKVSDFEEYLVRDAAPADVERIDLSAAAAAEPGPAVLEALEAARVILLCPSNPLASIGPIRALQAIEERLRKRRCAVGVSPIIGGRPVKGPADRLLSAIGAEVSALGVAELYRPIAAGFVIDTADSSLTAAIEALGLRVHVTETLMRNDQVARELARVTLELAEESP